MIYLDAAATTPVRREVLEAMWPHLTGEFGNPSSSHELGESAAAALAAARTAVAARFGCRPSEVVFTSGGTEADNLAIKGIALAVPRGRHLVVSAIEHEAVLASCDYLARHHGFEVTVVPVDREGLVDAAQLASSLRPDTTLVSIMLANNEVGTIQPVAELARLARAVGARFHTDAVQAAGSIEVNLGALGVDALSVSAHKLGAPKGIGALLLRSGVPVEPLMHGGGQERGRRSGTENVAGAVGFAAALASARPSASVQLRDAFIRQVLEAVPGTLLTGSDRQRLPGHASFCFPGTSGEAILLELGRRSIVCSSGSACAAGSDEPSPVLLAMGYAPEVAQTAVRFSWDADTTPEQLRDVVRALVESHAAVRGIGVR